MKSNWRGDGWKETNVGVHIPAKEFSFEVVHTNMCKAKETLSEIKNGCEVDFGVRDPIRVVHIG